MNSKAQRFLSMLPRAAALLSALIFCYAGNSFAQTPLAGIVKISAGSFHTCALTNGGGVKCWGSNQFGQMGVSLSLFSSSTPVDVTGLGSGIIAIAAGGSHTCALTASGGVKCWGLNQNGQLGDNGASLIRFAPADVSGLTSGAAAIAAGLLTTCAVTTGGAAKCWGANGVGQLGDGTTTSPALVPVNVSGLASGVAAIATYGGHSCALTTVGGIKCWGQNNSGQLGIGTPPNSSLVPVDVISAQSGPALTGASAIVVNFFSSCAVKGGGVLCWGDNTVGQLGNDLILFSSHTPANVLSGPASTPLVGVSAIATGSSHACALTTVGGVKCWGFNTSGQVGNGNNLRVVSTPEDVIAGPSLPPLSGVSALTAGEQHTCALMNSGGVKCWGGNFAGQLGDNSTAFFRFTPVDVLVLPSINLSAVKSRKTHGAAGDFDLLLDTTIPIIGGAVTVESRSTGASHLIVFQFTSPITATGAATAVNGSGAPIAISAVTFLGNEVSVTLTGVADNSRATISLTGVNGNVAASSVSMGFLVGDVNNTRSVDSIDLSSVKARSGQITDSTNFSFDLNASGAINSADILAVKARTGAVLVP